MAVVCRAGDVSIGGRPANEGQLPRTQVVVLLTSDQCVRFPVWGLVGITGKRQQQIGIGIISPFVNQKNFWTSKKSARWETPGIYNDSNGHPHILWLFSQTVWSKDLRFTVKVDAEEGTKLTPYRFCLFVFPSFYKKCTYPAVMHHCFTLYGDPVWSVKMTGLRLKWGDFPGTVKDYYR